MSRRCPARYDLLADADRGARHVAAPIERLELRCANYLHRSAPVPASCGVAAGLAAVSDGAVVVCARLSDGTAVFSGTLIIVAVPVIDRVHVFLGADLVAAQPAVERADLIRLIARQQIAARHVVKVELAFQERAFVLEQQMMVE